MKRPLKSVKFHPRPVVAAVALAVGAGAAHAAPTPNQMPGAGIVAAASLGSTIAVGTTYTNLPNGTFLPVDGKVVIRWGGPGAPAGETTNPYGFNLGVNAALYFAGTSPASSVLNIDASGNPSQIYGLLGAVSKGGWTPTVFVANANGIVVGPGGRIVAPEGVGLVGANLDNATSLNDFTANNGWVVPAPQALGTSYLSFGTIPATGNIVVGGQVNGDLSLNVPAKYVLVAGNNVDVLNTGNVFGGRVDIRAGLVATPTLAAVAGLSNQTVNRLWNVDAGNYEACCFVGPNPGNMTIVAGLTATVTNEGSISVAPPGAGGGAPTRVQPANGISPAQGLFIQAAGDVRSGIAGSMNDQVGLYSDFGIFVDSYSNASKVELYNVISGYTTNKTLPFLYVNNFAVGSYIGFRPDVTIDAIMPGAQPSSVATTGNVWIFGDEVSILSTINHKRVADGGTQGDAMLWIDGMMIDVAADVGAGTDVRIIANGPLTISGDALSDANGNGSGGIDVFNDGPGAPTTISGVLTVPSGFDSVYIRTLGPLSIPGGAMNANGPIDIHNDGTSAGNHTLISGSLVAGGTVHVYNGGSPTPKPLEVSGSITAYGTVDIENFGAAAGNTTTIAGTVTSTGGNVNVTHYGQPTGKLIVSGALSSIYDVNLFSDGHAQIGGMGVTAGDNINAEVLGTSLLIDGPWTAGDHIGVESLLAMTKFTPAGVLTAPAIDLMGLTFTGVNAAGDPYADASEKPAAQIVTHDLNVVLTGSINAPIAGNTNWLLNSIDILPAAMGVPVRPADAAPAALPPVLVSVTAVGGGFQAVNLRVLGDAIVDSGATTTPFVGVSLTTGGLPAGGAQGNLGSQLILQADGSMQVVGPSVALPPPPPPGNPNPVSGDLATLLPFQWPGGAVFRAGTTLQTFVPIYNAYTTASPPYGGLFFEAPYIVLGGYLATSGTGWANFSTPPVTGDPVVYQIRQTSPTSFGFEATTAFVKNAYSNSVTGGFVCTQTGPTTWTVCP